MKLSTLTITRLEKVASDLKMRLNLNKEEFEVSVTKAQDGRPMFIVEKINGFTHLINDYDIDIIHPFCKRRKLMYHIIRVYGLGIQITIY